MSSPRRRAAATVLALALVACREAERMPVEDVRLTFLEHPELWDVTRRSEAHPPRVDTLAPRPGSRAVALPCLVLPPPGEVRVRLPDGLPDDAVLRVACGADRDEWRTEGRARVRFELEIDGRVARDQAVWPRPGVRPGDPERSWRSLDAPLRGAREVVLRTSTEGTGGPPVDVGFARCEVVVRGERERARASRRRPSLLFVCVDTLRADRLGCYGADRPTSPAIDALAARGTRWVEAYATSPWTWPSTASLLTGLASPEHGLESQDSCYLSPELDTLAEVLQRAGATTAALSTNPLVTAGKGFGQGFEEFRVEAWADAHEVVPDAIAWLEANAERRFFYYLHLSDPHLPYEPEPDLAERFAPDVAFDYDGQVEVGLQADVEALLRGEGADAERVAEIVDHRLRLYDAEVAGVDRQLGRLFDALDRLGRDDVVVVVTSDHGEEFLEHGLLGHGKQLWDESVRVPLVLAGPGVDAGRVVEHAVESRHVCGTLAALLDVAPAPAWRAADLASPTGTAAAPLFLSVHGGQWVDRDAGTLEKVRTMYAVEVDGRRLFRVPPAADGARPERRLVVDPARGEAAAGPADELAARLDRWVAETAQTGRQAIGGGGATLDLLREIGYVE